jgi:hypothetical protein
MSALIRLKNLLHPRRERAVAVIPDQQPTSPEQVSQTRLTHGLRELHESFSFP